MATWARERRGERRNLIPPLSHTVSGGGEAILATYINELVVNLATYEQSHTRDSRRVLCRARCYGVPLYTWACVNT